MREIESVNQFGRDGSDKKLTLPVSFVSFEKGIMFSQYRQINKMNILNLESAKNIFCKWNEFLVPGFIAVLTIIISTSDLAMYLVGTYYVVSSYLVIVCLKNLHCQRYLSW